MTMTLSFSFVQYHSHVQYYSGVKFLSINAILLLCNIFMTKFFLLWSAMLLPCTIPIQCYITLAHVPLKLAVNISLFKIYCI